jgi:hypothetical protein
MPSQITAEIEAKFPPTYEVDDGSHVAQRASHGVDLDDDDVGIDMDDEAFTGRAKGH